MAYRFVAERNDEIVTRERASVYITLANARIWSSEGWQVTIIDDEGKQFAPAEFEAHITAAHPVIAHEMVGSLAPSMPADEAGDMPVVEVEIAAAAEVPGERGPGTPQTGVAGDHGAAEASPAASETV